MAIRIIKKANHDLEKHLIVDGKGSLADPTKPMETEVEPPTNKLDDTVIEDIVRGLDTDTLELWDANNAPTVKAINDALKAAGVEGKVSAEDRDRIWATLTS